MRLTAVQTYPLGTVFFARVQVLHRRARVLGLWGDAGPDSFLGGELDWWFARRPVFRVRRADFVQLFERHLPRGRSVGPPRFPSS